MTAILLQATNLTKRFRASTVARRVWQWGTQSVLAVDDISAQFHAGKVTAIMGPNGSGKTTLLRLLAEIMIPSEGNVKAEVDTLIYVPAKDYQFYERLTGHQNIRFFCRLACDSLADIEEAAEKIGLKPEVLHRPVWTYSAGMKVRLALVRAFLPDKKLVILDEPTRSMDLEGRRDVAVRLRMLADAGAAVIVATHDIDFASSADKILIIRDGRKVYEGEKLERSKLEKILGNDPETKKRI